MTRNIQKKKLSGQHKFKKENIPVKKEIFTNLPKWLPIAIIVYAALLYIKAVSNGFVGWDDDGYVIDNPFIRDFSWHGVKIIFSIFLMGIYHPFTVLIYLFEYKLFGLNPFPYHLLNILLHLLNTWLVFRLSEKLSGEKITAFVVSILFAVHPMHVESVAWISELKDVLYTLFYLLSLLVYMHFLKSEFKIKYYVYALLLFLCSLFSKSAAVTLPVLLIAIDIYEGRKINIKLFIEKIPFLLLSVLFGILSIFSQQTSLDNLPLDYSFIDRIFLFTYAISFYVIKLVAPFNLSIVHYYPDSHNEALPIQYYLSLIFLLLMIFLILRNSLFRKELLFGVSFFLITISVMLQIIPVGTSHTSERYTYVAYIGLFYIAGQWFSNFIKSWAKAVKHKGREIIYIIFILFIIMFSFQTWKRIGVWKNGNTLFTDAINKNPDMGQGYAYWNRGNIRKENNDLQGALQDYCATLKYKPKFFPCLVNRGNLYNKLNDYKNALKDLNLAVSIDSSTAEVYVYRGIAYEGLGNFVLALCDYNKAIKLNSDYAFAYNNRGVLKAKLGDISNAIKDIDIALKLNPEDATTYNNSGNIKAINKDYIGSLNDFNKSIKLNPNDNMVYFNRAHLRLILSDTAGACEDWEKAMKLGHKDASQLMQQYCH